MAGCNLPRTLAGEVSHATESTWLAGGRTWCTHTCAQVPAPYCTIKAACKDEWLARVTLQRHDRLHTHRQVGSCRKRNVLLSGSDNDPCSQVLTNKSTRKIQEMVFLVTCDLVVDALSPSADFLQITNCTATDFADKASQSRRLQLVKVHGHGMHLLRQGDAQQHAKFLAGSTAACNKLQTEPHFRMFTGPSDG